MIKKVKLVWSHYGNEIALGISGKLKRDIEQIYNLAYNYEITDGNLYYLSDNQEFGMFAYFLTSWKKLIEKGTKVDILKDYLPRNQKEIYEMQENFLLSRRAVSTDNII